MKRIFNNEKELAYYFLTENKDGRQWGIFSDMRIIFNNNQYRLSSGVIWDSPEYRINQNILCFSELDKKAQDEIFGLVCEYILQNRNFSFPCQYEVICTYADGRSTYYEVSFTDSENY